MGTFTFTETPLPGAYMIVTKAFGDTRGSFRMTYVKEDFAVCGIASEYVQTNISVSKPKHTIRGMHFQLGDAAQDKLVRCLVGSILDVIIDIRPTSATYGRTFSVTLTDANETMLFVPKGFAHGFCTLVDDTQVMYQVSAAYTPSAEGGIRWDDAAFAINWPTKTPILSDKDAKYPDHKLR
ncbi:MAG: dTDP-4-dehydrorhamnose 3,5-epimerase [Spirochaetota bacterium]